MLFLILASAVQNGMAFDPINDTGKEINCDVIERFCAKTEKYNCSLPGLEKLKPGIYEGVTANYLSFATENSSPYFPIRAKEFEACTGGNIIFNDALNIWEDPIDDLGTSSATGQEVYDGYLMSYSQVPEVSSLGLAEHLNGRISQNNERLKWVDVLPQARHMGEYHPAENVTNIDFLPYAADFFVPLIRLDLLEKHQLTLPNTWLEVVEIVKFFNGTDINEDGEPDFGFCHFPRIGAGFWDWFFSEMVYSTWASYAQTKGINEGFFFDALTMHPKLQSAGFREAVKIWKDLWANGCEAAIFSEGRCAVGLAPPGDWKEIFLDNPGVARRDDKGQLLWMPTLQNGEYAEPYRFRPFGSLHVVDPQNADKLVPCTKELCPKAEVVPIFGHHGENDRASKILSPSPHAGKLINRVPFFWSGSVGVLIRKSSSETKKNLLWDFLVYTNSPVTAVHDVANYKSWIDSWRFSQLSPGDNFVDAGWSIDSFNEHKDVMFWALGHEANGAHNLRMPGLKKYTYTVFGQEILKYIKDQVSLQDMVNEIEKRWVDITNSYGKINQLAVYRASLNIKPLSEADLCRLHRHDMDVQNPSTCRKYDPITKNFVLTGILVPLLIAMLAVVTVLYIENRRRNTDSVWSIKSDELIFDDPPEIIGRGTFGLVLLAEYRGTQVAVKRVIPRKDTKRTQPDDNNNEKNSWIVDKLLDMSLRNSYAMANERSISRQNSFSSNSSFKNEGHNSLDGKLRQIKLGVDTSLESHSFNGTLRRAGSVKSIISEAFDEAELGQLDDDIATVEDGMKSGAFERFARDGSSLKEFLAQQTSEGGSSTHYPKQRRRSTLLRGKRSIKEDYSKLKSDFILEMRCLSKLRHPCITTVMGAVIEKHSEPMLIMEYMDHGSLCDLLMNETVVIDGELLLPILRDIAQGMRFLHTASPEVIHGDLKAANVLVDGKFRAKVADFGLSQKKKVGAVGTPYWMSPELLRGETSSTTASDVYAFGILLYEAYSRNAPYAGEEYKNVIAAVCDPNFNKRPSLPRSTPIQIKALMTDCVDSNVHSRPTFREIDERLKRMNVTNASPALKTMSYQKEKQTNSLLYEVFPPKVAEALKAGKKVEPEYKEIVTIFFSDIVGFTTISSKLSPMKISDLLDRLYHEFDKLSHKFDIFKVETIGDAYMAVTNLVKDQRNDHTERIANFSVEAIRVASTTLIDVDDPSLGYVHIRVGFHSGPVVANVVGSRNPRYCLFGDTVNTASRMESTSIPGHIHCSERSALILRRQAPDLSVVSRGKMDIKGKGEMHTFWVFDNYAQDERNLSILCARK